MIETQTNLTDLKRQMTFVDFNDANFHLSVSDGERSQNKDTLLNALIYRPTIYQRNDIKWIAAHAWRAKAKEQGIAALKEAKRCLDPSLITEAAEPIAALIRQLIGTVPAQAMTCVPCGHSRRPDCFGKQLAHRVAQLLGVPFIQVFADRPCPGVSHPRRSAKLPPLQQIGNPPRSVILVDDLSTSGRHLEEVVLAMRRLGASASAFAWISGSATRGTSLSEMSFESAKQHLSRPAEVPSRSWGRSIE